MTAELGDYQLHELVGVGRMGAVHRATDRRSGREVAVKVLHEHIASDPHYRPRFEREVRLLTALHHQHIVPIYDAGHVDGRLFLAMPLLCGRTLKDLIAAAPLDPEEAVTILEAVADALDVAHAAGIVHRDVKPNNVLLGTAGEVFLADFGLASSPDGDELTAPGDVLGTIDYMAPEHLDGERAHPAADIYALACTAIEALTGDVPFPRDTTAAVMLAHVVHEPPRVSVRRPELPPALDDVLLGGMAKDPLDRPLTASALIAGLREVLDAPALPAAATG